MFKKTVILTLLLIVFASYNKAQNNDLEASFATPPASVQTACYWYWISNNISEDGVVKDLYAMKKAGINRAFIGNIGLNDTPYGKVQMLTEEWWKILHTALKTATELNIEIGIFNSPGWSQSGGPWVSHKEAMRYFTSTQIKTKGAKKIAQKIEKPIDEFQDIKVIAYPVSALDDKKLNASNIKTSSQPVVDNINFLFDNNTGTAINFPANGDSLEISITSEKEFLARHISIQTTQNRINATVEFYGKDKSGAFVLLKKFQADRFNPELIVGFKPYAPIVETFEPFSGTDFKVVFKNFNPEQGIAEIDIASGARIERYAEKTFAKMHQTFLPYWEAYQWEKQASAGSIETFVDPKQVLDISDKMQADGTLLWDVPAGEWIIERIGVTPTGTKNAPAAPEATGYEVDKMSKKHVAMHFDGHIGEVLKRIPVADRKTFKVVVQDSYEMGGQNYTDDFFERFEKEYGYSALPFLPAFSGRTVQSQDASDRFLWDMRRLVATMVATEYVGGMREVSNKHGLTTWLENYGHWGFPSESLLYGSYSDEISGEYWAEGDLGNIENRIASSCGHIYNKKKIWAESYTCGGNPYGRTPAMIKQRGDRFFAEGINSSLLHVFITQPDDRVPGINAWFGTEFNRTNTWFTQLDLFTDYLKRINFMLQQGENVADVAYFIGEDAPKMTGTTDPALPQGYQFDYVNNDVILNYMTVKDGFICLPHGTKYRMLVLPKLQTMTPEMLVKINQLILDGAVVYGNPPTSSPSLKNYPQSDKEVQALAKKIWGEVDGKNIFSRSYGKGRIISGIENMETVLDMITCRPDCELSNTNVHYSHRSSPNSDVYFLTNQTVGEKVEFTAKFRVNGKQPEIWYPTSGEMRILKGYVQKENYIEIPLMLHPNECAFVVFRENTKENSLADIRLNFPERKKLVDLNNPWRVDFKDKLRGEKEIVTFNELTDWSKHPNEKIKYYSGTSVYSSEFTLKKTPKTETVVLNLSNVSAMAKVKINGQYVGGVWTYPYELNVSQFIKKGKNSIEVEVVNTWVNRLVGDVKLPEEKRTTWTVHRPGAEYPLQTSGLLGPVYLETISN